MDEYWPNGFQVIDEATMHDVVRRIVDRFHPRRIVVFGSHARGDAGPDSDLDLFVEMESDLSPLDRNLEFRRFLDDRRYPIDVVVYTPDEVTDARRRFGNLMSYIDAEGRTLYERP